MPVRYSESSFEPLADHVAFCLENIRHPRCTLPEAGRFYEEAAEHLRAHAILRLLVDADGDGFANDLVMSGRARRAWLRRCAQHGYADYFIALSRSGSMLDAIASDDLELAAEIFELSPTSWREGDEYEDDFCYRRFLGLQVAGAPANELEAALDHLRRVAEGDGARLAVCVTLQARDADGFEQAFEGLLQERREEIVEQKGNAEEDLCVALGAMIFAEGVAVLKLARHAGIAVAFEYPMCPALALLQRRPARPADEFAVP